jgi:hypothetical protein
LGVCPEIDGKTYVDTKSAFLTRGAFGLVPLWYTLPHALAPVGDRVFWQAVQDYKLSHAHNPNPTVNFRTRYASHYTYFQKTPPADAIEVHIVKSKDGKLVSAELRPAVVWPGLRYCETPECVITS